MTCTWVKRKAQKKIWDHVLFENDWISSKWSLNLFLDNLFNSLSLIVKLYERGLYGIGTAQKDTERMLEIPVDIRMKRGDFEYLYSNKVAWGRWLYRHSITILFSNADEMATKPTVPRWQKRSTSKIQVPCPDVIKIYKKGMGGVDLIELIIWIENQLLDFICAYFLTW